MEGMKDFVMKSILVGSLGMSTSGYSQEIATIREIGPQEAEGKIGIILKVVSGEIAGFCNFGKMRINNQVMTVTAKHCVIENMGVRDTFSSEDYIVAQNITKWFKDRGFDVQFLTPYPAPIRDRSDETNQSIVGKPVTINSCIPGSGNVMQCWEIRGTAQNGIINPYQNSIRLSNTDYERILKSGDRNGGAVTGMSGNVVLDTYGKVFGVVSTASKYSRRLPYQVITFEPLRNDITGGKTKIIPY